MERISHFYLSKQEKNIEMIGLISPISKMQHRICMRVHAHCFCAASTLSSPVLRKKYIRRIFSISMIQISNPKQAPTCQGGDWWWWVYAPRMAVGFSVAKLECLLQPRAQKYTASALPDAFDYHTVHWMCCFLFFGMFVCFYVKSVSGKSRNQSIIWNILDHLALWFLNVQEWEKYKVNRFTLG